MREWWASVQFDWYNDSLGWGYELAQGRYAPPLVIRALLFAGEYLRMYAKRAICTAIGHEVVISDQGNAEHPVIEWYCERCGWGGRGYL